MLDGPLLAVALAATGLYSVHVTLLVQREVNRIRDAVISGIWEGRRVSVEHRWILFLNDWLPYNVGFAFTTVVYSLIVLCIPVLFGNGDVNVMIVCAISAGTSLVTACASGVFTYSEYHTLRDRLRRLPQNRATESSIEDAQI